MLFGIGPATHKYASLMNASSDDVISENNLINIINLNEFVQQSILQLNYDTAEFLSELLFAECKKLSNKNIHKIESIYLYALSLYLNGSFNIAFDVSKDFKHLNIGIAYIYALCSCKLNEQKYLSDSIKILLDFREKLNTSTQSSTNFSATVNANSSTTTTTSSNLIHFPNNATISCLLGKLFQKIDNNKESAIYFTDALHKNPFLWEAYIELSNSKATVDLKKLYTVMVKRSQQLQQHQQQHQFNPSASLHHTQHPNRNRFNSVTKPYSTPFKSTRNSNSSHNNNTTSNPSSVKKPISSGSVLNKANVVVATTSNAYNSNFPSSQRQTANSKASTKHKIILNSPPKKFFNDTSTLKTPKGKTTPTHSINSTVRSTTGVLNKDQANLSTSFASSDSSSASFIFSSLKNNGHNNNRNIQQIQQQNSSMTLIDLMYTFAKIMKASCLFDSYKAIRLIMNDIPTYLRENMPWCQAQLGKFHYELVNYEMSLQYFSNLRNLQPSRVKDLEIYSTLLWHLNDKTKLSVLSNELIINSPRTPETWCCMGNFLSVQKNHNEAIKAFEKATHVEPKFAYAYTLQGHEYTSNDSFDMAKRCYRKALACDTNHYNAYYGLGMVSMKLGQYEEALLFFEKARSINPINVVLVCCCGVALEKLNYQEKALQYYELACELQPSSSLATFKRAHLLYSMGRYNLALRNFEELKNIAPDEATVHFLLGQIYSILGRKKDAIKEYTVALNLDPKGRQLIMEALEKCHTLD